MANDGLQIEINAMKAQNKATISDVHEGKKGTLVGSRVPKKLTSARYRTLSCILLGPISNRLKWQMANAKSRKMQEEKGTLVGSRVPKI